MRGGPAALTARDALRLATMGGAACLGRAGEIGSLEPGKRADIALWRLDGPLHADIADPVTALALGATPPLDLLLVEGREVVRHDESVTVDEADASAALVTAARRLAERASAG
jgi:cytosine/adenosine deaminase-related metal-dependent hydrolase